MKLRRRSLLCAALAATAVRAAAATPKPLVLGSIQAETSFAGRWLRSIYAEAFGRMGLPFEIAIFPTQRLSQLSDQGEVDGDVARVHGYAAAHPQLIRVEEPVMEARLALYGLDSQPPLPSLEALGLKDHTVAYPRGVAICQSTLARAVPAERIVDVNDGHQALRMLLAHRVELFCTSDLGIQNSLVEPEFRNVTGVHMVLDLGPHPFYPYLHRRHAALAPTLAATLKQMKTEGLLERYRAEALAQARKP